MTNRVGVEPADKEKGYRSTTHPPHVLKIVVNQSKFLFAFKIKKSTPGVNFRLYIIILNSCVVCDRTYVFVSCLFLLSAFCFLLFVSLQFFLSDFCFFTFCFLLSAFCFLLFAFRFLLSAFFAFCFFAFCFLLFTFCFLLSPVARHGDYSLFSGVTI